MYGQIYKLIADTKRILPFQFTESDTILTGTWSVEIVDMNGNATDITTPMSNAGLHFRDLEQGNALVIFPAALLITGVTIKEGGYYLKFTFENGNEHYSEIFTAINNPFEKFIKLVYWEEGDFESNDVIIDYTYPFKNYLYLDTEIGKPDYEFEEVVTKRDGYEFVEKQVSEKTYNFEFLAPEYLCDALRIVRMHDHVKIYDKYGTYDVDTIIITPKWQKNGDVAAVAVEFQTDTVIKKVGKILAAPGADFNDDFNNDFKTE